MSKRTNQVEASDLLAELADSRHIFQTKGGKTIELVPIPPLQAQRVREGSLRKAIELYGEAVKPTYKTEMDEVFEHDETTLATDEDRAAWDTWKRTQAQHDAYVSNKMLEFFIYHGVKADPDADPAWEEMQRYFDVEIPTNPVARKIHYVQTEYIFDAEDINQLGIRLMEMAGVRPEVVEAAAASFRS